MSSPRLAHNVFFKLKDATPAKVDELVAACHKYLNVQPGIVFFAAGPLCAELTREVNDRDWHVGLHLVFDSKASHDASLSLPQVRAAIAKGKPLIAGFSDGAVTTPVGGHGLAAGKA